MTIRIIKEPDIYITERERSRLLPEWERSQRMTTRPVSFKEWLRDNHSQQPLDPRPKDWPPRGARP